NQKLYTHTPDRTQKKKTIACVPRRQSRQPPIPPRRSPRSLPSRSVGEPSGAIEESKMTLSLLAADADRPYRRGRSALLGTFWLILAVPLALAWLALPYLLNGRRVLGDVGYSIQAERMNRSSATARLLIRAAYGPGEADVDVLYATTEYLDLIDPSGAARKYQPGRYLVFLVTETTHVDQLPAQPPHATLLIDGRRVEIADVNGPADVRH